MVFLLKRRQNSAKTSMGPENRFRIGVPLFYLELSSVTSTLFCPGFSQTTLGNSFLKSFPPPLTLLFHLLLQFPFFISLPCNFFHRLFIFSSENQESYSLTQTCTRVHTHVHTEGQREWEGERMGDSYRWRRKRPSVSFILCWPEPHVISYFTNISTG